MLKLHNSVIYKVPKTADVIIFEIHCIHWSSIKHLDNLILSPMSKKYLLLKDIIFVLVKCNTMNSSLP